jgi:hypothetical protein
MDESTYEILGQSVHNLDNNSPRSSLNYPSRKKKLLRKSNLLANAKLQDKINQWIIKDQNYNICRGCLNDISDSAEYTYSQMRKKIELLLAVRHQLDNITYKHIDTTKLSSQVAETESSIDKLKKFHNLLHSHNNLIMDSCRVCDNNTQSTSRQITSITADVSSYNDMLEHELYLSHLSQYEMTFLSIPRLQPLFHIHHRIVTSGDVVLVVNGWRASFLPIPEIGLSWQEINFAWSNICLALSAYLNECGISTFDRATTSLQFTSSERSEFHTVSYMLISLRQRCIIVNSIYKSEIYCLEVIPKESKPSSVTAMDEYLIVSASDNLENVEKDNTEQEIIEPYLKSLIALAIMVVELAVCTRRRHVLTGKKILKSIETLVVKYRISTGNCIHANNGFNEIWNIVINENNSQFVTEVIWVIYKLLNPE